MPWNGSPQPWPQANCGNSPGTAARAPLWGQRLPPPFRQGTARLLRPHREACGAAAWRPVGYWGFAMEQGGEGGMDIIPPGWQEKAILVLPPEAKPCKSHDGGGGTAPCRGEKGGCHARCT